MQFLIMGVSSSSKRLFLNSLSTQGQSVLEFTFMLPVLVGLSLILIRMNTAIQMGIVDQQYARAQALFLAFNSPFYPENRHKARLIQTGDHQIVIGVSDNIADTEDGNYTPRASVQRITRQRKQRGSEKPKSEPIRRANVRIRNTVTLCTQSLTLPDGTPYLNYDQRFEPVGTFNYSENVKLNNICRGSLLYE